MLQLKLLNYVSYVFLRLESTPPRHQGQEP